MTAPATTPNACLFRHMKPLSPPRQWRSHKIHSLAPSRTIVIIYCPWCAHHSRQTTPLNSNPPPRLPTILLISTSLIVTHHSTRTDNAALTVAHASLSPLAPSSRALLRGRQLPSRAVPRDPRRHLAPPPPTSRRAPSLSRQDRLSGATPARPRPALVRRAPPPPRVGHAWRAHVCPTPCAPVAGVWERTAPARPTPREHDGT